MKFSKLGLDKWIATNLTHLQYLEPSSIQESVIPILTKDTATNLIGIASTGTGKTASFCLPILNNLAKDPSGIYALILEPTRELAMQVVEKLKVYTNGFNLRVNLIIGGVDFTDQLTKLNSIPHILVATPGRLSWLLKYNSSGLNFLNNVKYLVLDEFDQLLNDTIIGDVSNIIDHLPKERQTLFFSATINYEMHTDEFFKKFYVGSKPLIFDHTNNIKINNSEDCTEIGTVQENLKLPKGLTQKYILIPNKTKEHYLIHLLQNDFKKKYMIIFVSNCKQCHFLSLLLGLFSIKVSSIHSQMPQRKRFDSLEKFKARLSNVLIATDIASRGLDIPSVEIVINYDLNRNPNDYIHRVGRTARAGKTGMSISFVTQYDVELVLAIEENSQSKMEEFEVGEDAVMENVSLVAKGIRLVQMKIYESGFNEKVDNKSKKKRKEKKKTMELTNVSEEIFT